MNFEFIEFEERVTDEVYCDYIASLEPQFYKILGVYEKCIDKEDLTDFHIFLDGLATQMPGSDALFSDAIFLKLLATIVGLGERTDLTKKKVKSIAFSCCNSLNKARGYVR